MVDPAPRGELQALVLSSLVTGRPLPGTSSPVRLADLSLAMDRQGAVRVLESGLAADAVDRVEAAAATRTAQGAARLTVESEAEATAPSSHTAAVLRVRGPEPVAGQVDAARVTVEVCGTRGGTLLPLDTAIVVLHREADAWIASGPPTELAT